MKTKIVLTIKTNDPDTAWAYFTDLRGSPLKWKKRNVGELVDVQDFERVKRAVIGARRKQVG